MFFFELMAESKGEFLRFTASYAMVSLLILRVGISYKTTVL